MIWSAPDYWHTHTHHPPLTTHIQPHKSKCIVVQIFFGTDNMVKANDNHFCYLLVFYLFVRQSIEVVVWMIDETIMFYSDFIFFLLFKSWLSSKMNEIRWCAHECIKYWNYFHNDFIYYNNSEKFKMKFPTTKYQCHCAVKHFLYSFDSPWKENSLRKIVTWIHGGGDFSMHCYVGSIFKK